MGALGVTDFWTYVVGTVAIILLPGPNSLFVLSTGARRGVRAGYQAAAGVFLGDTVLMTLSAAGVASLLRAYPPVFMVIKYAGAAYLLWVGVGILRDAIGRWRGLGGAVPSSATPRGAGRATGSPTGTVSAGPGSATAASTAAGSIGAVPSGVGSATGSSATGGSAGAVPAGPSSAGASSAGASSAGAVERNPFRRSFGISLLNPKAILFFVSFFIQFVRPGYAYPAIGFLVLGLVLQVVSALYLSMLIFGGRFLAGQFQRRRKLAAAGAGGVGALFVGFSIKLATASIT
jgi:leucine efflux protein